MYPPDIYVFKNKEEAYAFYTKEKNKILIMKEDYNIDYHVIKQTDSECIIQYGYDSEHGAKRPVGVIIKKCKFIE
jgi:chloramphenicol O-acetyltransferase